MALSSKDSLWIENNDKNCLIEPIHCILLVEFVASETTMLLEICEKLNLNGGHSKA